MRLIKILAITLGLWLPSAVYAQKVVVELFTSQGCSSCPPADEILRELALEDDVIVLGWHIDYWDYLGWKDEFSRPENTERQKGYRDRWNLRSLYTPQAVIHGEAQVVGSNEQEIRMYVGQFQAEKPMLEIATSTSGDSANISVSALTARLPASDIFLVRITPEATTSIRRGENAGKTINYVNVVQEMTWIGNWNGRSDVNVNASIRTDSKYVVLVQAKDLGPVLGAEYLN
ncbi:MAG: DUF1223 domain-containing protein [Rhodobacteraceae bacterium]|nr:DUF1223 domain-containing protein [Paracoccaceae bacterium]